MPRGSERVPCEMNYTFVRERTDCGGIKELKTKMHFQDKQEPIKAIKNWLLCDPWNAVPGGTV